MSLSANTPRFDVRIDVIIVNYNSAGFTVKALHHLEKSRDFAKQFFVHVVDNNSPQNDGAALQEAIVENKWNDWISLHPQETNLGFAAGNNVALQDILNSETPPDYVYLLNPDAYPREGAIEKLVLFLEQHPKVGLVGSALEDEHHQPQISAFRFPSILGEFERGIALSIITKLLLPWRIAPPVRDETYQTDWVSGASMMVRKAVFDTIGIMDPEYFLYFEETDFMRQAAKANLPTWYVHTSRVVHLAGQSTHLRDGHARGNPLPKYWFDSWRRYFTKNHSKAYALAAGFAWMGGALLYNFHRLILRRPSPRPPNSITLFWTYCISPILLGKRQ